MKTNFLTDSMIDLYASDVLTTHDDIDLNYDAKVQFDPVKGGIYDKRIFGSIFKDQCNCGRLHNKPGMTCSVCHSMQLDPVSQYTRFAKIESPIYYCNEMKFNELKKFMSKLPLRVLEDVGPEFYRKNTKSIDWKKVYENLQFEYMEDDKGNPYIAVTSLINDTGKCSYEGILAILVSHYKNLVSTFLSIVNKKILVVPIAMRPPIIRFTDKKELHNDVISSRYKNLLYMIHEFYSKKIDLAKTPKAQSYFNGIMRRYIALVTGGISGILKPSKANITRTMQQHRLYNSGRATIVPAPDLRIDEVYIPRHLIYECCKKEFIQFIVDNKGVDVRTATMMYRDVNNDPEVRDLFSQYIEGNGDPNTAKYVLINRAPSLHEHSMMMLRVRLTTDYCMKIPMAICKGFNADFDGDSMSFFAVPKIDNRRMLRTMGIDNIIYYKKSHQPIFTPTQEILQGIVIGTRMREPNKKRYPDACVLEFDSIDEAYAESRKTRWLTLTTKIKITGFETTIARELFSKLFDKRVESFFEEGKYNLTGSTIAKLYVYLSTLDDRTDRIQKIQELALRIVTLSGATALTVEELYYGINKDTMTKIQKIVDDKSLSDEVKKLRINKLYSDYAKEVEDSMDDKVTSMISDSNRMKITQYLELVMPRVTTDPQGRVKVGHTALIEGMTPSDFMALAIENRSVQDIKQLAVPLSGYLTRQFVYRGNSVLYLNEVDAKNEGILIRRDLAEGRTTLDGQILEKSSSKEMVKVRSVVSSNELDIVRSDQLPKKYYNYSDSSIVGVAMITALTEHLTQSGLSLKHGGNLFTVEPNGELIATENCTVNTDKDFIYIITSTGTKKLPRPEGFILNGLNSYEKGDIIGALDKYNTPTYILDSLINLCGANKVRGHKKFERNKMLTADCYCVADGEIHYKVSAKGEKEVWIGGIKYQYSPNVLYFFPEGAKVKKYDRICSGIISMRFILSRKIGYIDAYYFFRNQFTELTNVSQELIELLYTLIVTKITKDNVVFKGVVASNKQRESLFTTIAFGYASQRLKKVTVEGEEFVLDPWASLILPLLLTKGII